MTKRLNLGVIFGGRSGEHEISVRSARSVIDAIDRQKYEVTPIAITREGKWLSPARSSEMLPESTRRMLPEEVAHSSAALTIVGDPSRRGLHALEQTSGADGFRKLDVVFPVLHGTFGEDGTIQGLLEMAGIPYVGCGVLASSCGMDKVTMKALFRGAKLPQCKYEWFLRADWESNPERVLESSARSLGFPVFVKPANLGSSVGVSRADDTKSLAAAMDLAARYDRKILVEEGVDAREIECAVMGNNEPSASLPGEYVVHDERAKFLDYTEKYSSTGHVEFVVPAPISKRLTERVRSMSVRAFKAIDGAGFARVDFFLLRKTNKLLVNELNTIPGLTEVSGFPKMWEGSGIPFSQVIDRLVALAIERHADLSRNQTTL